MLRHFWSPTGKVFTSCSEFQPSQVSDFQHCSPKYTSISFCGLSGATTSQTHSSGLTGPRPTSQGQESPYFAAPLWTVERSPLTCGWRPSAHPSHPPPPYFARAIQMIIRVLCWERLLYDAVQFTSILFLIHAVLIIIEFRKFYSFCTPAFPIPPSNKVVGPLLANQPCQVDPAKTSQPVQIQKANTHSRKPAILPHTTVNQFPLVRNDALCRQIFSDPE